MEVGGSLEQTIPEQVKTGVAGSGAVFCPSWNTKQTHGEHGTWNMEQPFFPRLPFTFQVSTRV